MKKAKERVAEVFNCPFCNYSKTVECKMDRKKHLGTISCRICGANFQMMINHLTEPIDIYSDWIDECAQVNEVNQEGTTEYSADTGRHTPITGSPYSSQSQDRSISYDHSGDGLMG